LRFPGFEGWGADGRRKVGMLRTFKDLKVWQKSYNLCLKVYGLSKQLPRDERYELSSQLRRAAVSVPSNVAEGYSRKTTNDYLRFLWIASGSLGELETQLLLSKDLGLCHESEVAPVIEATAEVERMLRALIRSLEEKGKSSAPPAP